MPTSLLQILVTGHDFAAPDGHTNFQHTMNSLLAMKVVPVINANDTFFPSPQKHADLTDVRL